MEIIDVNNECILMFHPKTKSELLDSAEMLTGKSAVVSFIEQLKAICNNERFLVLDTEIETSTGEVRYIHFHWNVMKGYEDSYERIIISTEDITKRREAEKIIVESQRKIEELVNSIDGIVWECDYERLELTFISKKSEDILGFTPEEWMADSYFWENHLHHDDKEESILAFTNIKKENKQTDFEYRMICKDGSVIWVRRRCPWRRTIFPPPVSVSLKPARIPLLPAELGPPIPL